MSDSYGQHGAVFIQSNKKDEINEITLPRTAIFSFIFNFL